MVLSLQGNFDDLVGYEEDCTPESLSDAFTPVDPLFQ